MGSRGIASGQVVRSFHSDEALPRPAAEQYFPDEWLQPPEPLPARVGLVWFQRRIIKGESALGSLRVAAALMPTLIFTLVLATIMRERFNISDALYGGLLIYAGVSTILPSLVLSKPITLDMLPEHHPLSKEVAKHGH